MSTAFTKTMAKTMEGENSLFHLAAYSPSWRGVRARTQGVNLRARGWSRDHRGMLLTSLLSVTCSTCFVVHTRSTCLGWHWQQCAGISHIDHQSRKFPTGLLRAQFGGGIFSTGVFSSLINLTYKRLRKTIHHNCCVWKGSHGHDSLLSCAKVYYEISDSTHGSGFCNVPTSYQLLHDLFFFYT